MAGTTRSPLALAAILAALIASGCGGGSSADLEPGPVPEGVEQAETVDPARFPKADGRTLVQILQEAAAQASLGLGSGTFTPSAKERLAFAVLGEQGAPVYGPTVVYVARSPDSPAKGPFAAPIDPMVPQQKFLSKQAALAPEQLKAIYETEVPLDRPGKWAALSLTRTPEGLVAGTTDRIEVAATNTVPKVGSPAPKVATPTGETGAVGPPVDTRDPRAPSLHAANFAEVVGKRPVALLFASPQFCLTKVCGPVTDLLLQLQAAYGDRIEMIQQEPYSTFPKPSAQMRQFGLVAPDGGLTEPWLFTVSRDGRVAARLEGAFGINAMNRAVEAAISGAR